jgi:hypothetical protein
MERGDIAAVILALFLIIVLTFLLSPQLHASRQAPVAITPTPNRATLPALTSRMTEEPTQRPTPALTLDLPTLPPVTTRRISYTRDFNLFPVRFIMSDMGMYGFSDVDWPYNSSVTFAYVEENHGGITEPFTVPYPIWRMTSTVYSTKTPEKAKFKMILVDKDSGQVLEGAEIQFPGTVTKTVVAKGRPLYMVIRAENVDRFVITLDAPSVFVQ